MCIRIVITKCSFVTISCTYIIKSSGQDFTVYFLTNLNCMSYCKSQYSYFKSQTIFLSYDCQAVFRSDASGLLT